MLGAVMIPFASLLPTGTFPLTAVLRWPVIPRNPQLDLLPPPFPTLGTRGNGMTVVPRGITGHLSTSVRAKAREAKGIITAADQTKVVAIVTTLNQAE